MRSILNQGTSPQAAPLGKAGLKIGAIALMLIGMAAAFGTSPSTVVAYQGKFDETIEPVSISAADRIVSDIRGVARETRIQTGDSAGSLLAKLGIQDEKLLGFLYADKAADTFFRQLAPGKSVSAEVSPDGKLLSMLFPLNNGDTALNITRSGDGFVTQNNVLPFTTRIVSQSSTIQHSLFGAADEAGIPDDVAIGLADIFGGEIDFHRDLRKGDSFSVVYEVTEFSGRPTRTKRILAAEFINDGVAHLAYWYRHDDGTVGYYAETGASLRKAFLRSPLEFSRISSGFSKARYHPVLREFRAHRGIDYAAPTGTRVRSTGDGVISFAGTQGGYGKVITIRHTGNKTTVYGHLSGFAPGIRSGKRISQGDTIGFVGSTGLATGPHLHYEFRVDGIHRNPLTIALPPAMPLPPSALPGFYAMTADLLAKMNLTKGRQLAVLD